MKHKSELFNKSGVKNITGCGILPYSIHKGKIFFLLGREAKYTEWKDGHKWAEFAGHRNDNESMFDATIREGYEEIMGLISKDDIKKKIKINDLLVYNNSTAFLIKIPYNPKLPQIFNNFYTYMTSQYNESFFVNSIIDKGTFEKDQIQWFEYNEIIELSKKDILREAMIMYLPQIKEFIKVKLK